MMKFIENPNLPKEKVTSLICGKLPLYLQKFLEEKKITVFESEPNSAYDSAVKTHADMIAIHLGKNRVIVEKNQLRLIENLQKSGLNAVPSAKEVKGLYPYDIGLNVAIFGGFAVGNFKHTDPELFNAISDYTLINVKQGYSKCSLLPITETAVITDDSSIYEALKNRCDTLLISKGDIKLDGHSYGFIGGAAAKISENEILFFGDVTKHRDYNAIASFLKKYGCNVVCFEGEALNDLGGFITLTEW